MKLLLFCLTILNIEFAQSYPTKISILPLGNVNSKYLKDVENAITTFYGSKVEILKTINSTDDLFAQSKRRLDASKVLQKFRSLNHTIVVTESDIAAFKSKDIPEWGVIGLGYNPGKICVISSFRITKNVPTTRVSERIKKVTIHEIGHNLGLNHCSTNDCIMVAARGSVRNIDNAKFAFCHKCRITLSKK